MLPFRDPRPGFCMSHHPIINPDRRSLLIKAAVTSASLIIPQCLLAAELVPTPGQTEGPFYPVEFPALSQLFLSYRGLWPALARGCDLRCSRAGNLIDP